MDSSLTQANLVAVLAADKGAGPLWATESEDLDCTFVAWDDGKGVVAHRNSEVDVVMVVVSGTGEVTVDSETIEVSTGQVLVIPKDAERSILAKGGRLAYLNVHKRRRRLMPGNPANRKPLGGPPRSALF